MAGTVGVRVLPEREYFCSLGVCGWGVLRIWRFFRRRAIFRRRAAVESAFRETQKLVILCYSSWESPDNADRSVSPRCSQKRKYQLQYI